MKEIKIRYFVNEIGPAELLEGQLARILALPVFTGKFWRNDIVKLTHLPTDAEPCPAIEKVVFTRRERRSVVTFDDDYAANKLMDLFALLGADSAVLPPEKEGKRCHLSVAHPEALDVAAVAGLFGYETVPFPDDDKRKTRRNRPKQK